MPKPCPQYNAVRKFLFKLCTLSFILITQAAYSSGNIQVQYLQDSSDSENIFLDIASDISKNTSLFGGVGNTRSPASAADLNLDYWNIGFGYRFTKYFDIELESAHFGQGNDINTDSVNAMLRWSSEEWSLSLRPQYDKIELLISFNNNSRIRNIDSTGLGVSATYYGMPNWEYSLSYDAYRYSDDPRILGTALAVALISSKAIAVTSGLKDHIISADATYLLPQTDISIGYATSQSAIDQSTSNIISISTAFYQFLPFKFGIEAGAVSSDIDTASYYAGFTVGYLW